MDEMVRGGFETHVEFANDGEIRGGVFHARSPVSFLGDASRIYGLSPGPRMINSTTVVLVLSLLLIAHRTSSSGIPFRSRCFV